MWADRNVTIKVGPDAERKILHLTLRGGLYGQITEFFTTYGDAPGLPYLGTHGQSRAPASTPDNNGVTALQDCIVTTFGILNFRQSPAGSINTMVPYDTAVTAIARTDAWFQVSYGGAMGWISADWVSTRGNCA